MVKNFEKILSENPILSREIHQIREDIERERAQKKWSFDNETKVWSRRNTDFLKKYGYKLVSWPSKGEGVFRLQRV